MKLNKLSVSGYRSLLSVEIDFLDLTVLIGENDSGKSSLLDLLEIFLNNKSPDEEDYFCDIDGQRKGEIVIQVEFELDESDSEANEYAIDNFLVAQKTFQLGESGYELCRYGEAFEDEDLNVDFRSLNATEQKELIQKFEPEVAPSDISNAKKRSEWIELFKQKAPKRCDWVTDKGAWEKYLPRFERYSAMDYKTPSSLITKTLRQVFEQSIFETVEKGGQETRQLIQPLQDVEQIAQAQLAAKIDELEDHIKRYNRRIKDFGYQPQFDFLSSLKEGEFRVDSGRGLHPLSKVGDGSKRRMFLAVMEWDREVILTQAHEESNLPAIIRGYDEPDTNLHYEAQRLMYQSISDIVYGEKSRVQAILCTHSLAMIDRAPAQNIRMLRLDDDGCTQVEKLDTRNDPDIEKFLLELARELGITNSVIFYERCFVLIEGETEENALPILYKKRYQRSLVEEGIRIINVRGNGAVKEFLRLLSNNRQKYTLIYIDKDTEGDRSAKLRKEHLKEAQFAEKFIDEHVIYVGKTEFEDIFPDEQIVNCLQLHWPKAEGEWKAEEIAQKRVNGKFSDQLGRLVFESHTQENGNRWTKPEFGKALAEMCPEDEIPQSILDFFEKARQISGENL